MLDWLLAPFGSRVDAELTVTRFGTTPEAAEVGKVVGPASRTIFNVGVAPTATLPKLQTTCPPTSEHAADPFAAVVATESKVNPVGRTSFTWTLVAVLSATPAIAVFVTV